MQQQDRIWHLLSRYLTGDAAEDEIKELQEITANDPPLKTATDTLYNFWKTESTIDKEGLKNAWNKHVQRLD